MLSSEGSVVSRFYARYAALGGVQEALARMGWEAGRKLELEDVGKKEWRPDGTVHALSYSRCTVRVRIEEESTKINANLVDRGELEKILTEKSGLSQETAKIWTDRIMDFIDGDDVSRDLGAEKIEYEEAGLSYGPFNRPLRYIEEILLIPGVEWETFWYGMETDDQDDLLPGIRSPFSLLTVYGNRKALVEDAENEETVVWKNGGLYRILSGALCGRYGRVVIYAIVKLDTGSVPHYRIVEIKEML